MKIKKKAKLCTIIIITTLLSGCWNYREINDLSIVSGIAIDRHPSTNLYQVTAETVAFTLSQTGVSTNSKILQADGATIFDAVRNMIKSSPKRLYWGHSLVFIVSEAQSKEGIIEVLDWVTRDQETRSEAVILISKDATAKEILLNSNSNGNPICFDINESLASQKSLSKALKVEIYKFINTLSSEGVSSTLPTISLIENESSKTYEISGTALFKGDKQIGYIDGEETKYLLFVIDQVKRGLLIEKEPSERQHPNITLEVYTSKTKAKPVVIDDELVIQINVTIQASLAELGTNKNLLTKSGIEMLESNAEKSLKDNMEKLIKRVQTDFGTDVFGFGRLIRREMPEYWKSESSNWDELFKDVKTSVNVDMNITNSAFTSQPIKIGD